MGSIEIAAWALAGLLAIAFIRMIPRIAGTVFGLVVLCTAYRSGLLPDVGTFVSFIGR